ncbi:MAG: hypothetical protein VCA74_01265 [Deltaproteobacteria bacterium]
MHCGKQLVDRSPGVAGGQYGHCPQLASPGTDNEDDLCMTCDFRDFYGTMLNR